MKVVAIFGDAPNQAALACKLADVHPIDQIILVRLPPAKKKKTLIKVLIAASVGLPFRFAWMNLQRYYRERFDWPTDPHMIVSSANHPEVLRTVESAGPNLVLVSGTDLLRDDLIKVIAKTGKIMNLHTGISPYIKGGPNCTNWALYCNRPDLIGNTIMWLDQGIDTGNIITTEQVKNPSFQGLSELHLQVMEHAHDLYCRAFRDVAVGVNVPSIPQADIAKGRLFLTRHWNARAMLRALINFQLIRLLKGRRINKEVRLVPLLREKI